MIVQIWFEMENNKRRQFHVRKHERKRNDDVVDGAVYPEFQLTRKAQFEVYPLVILYCAFAEVHCKKK